jgi:uncharacterized protein (TIGR02679 family)
VTTTSEVTVAGQRQLDLLASPPFTRLWDRVHALLERRGRDLGDATVGLSAATDAERAAIAGLLGRRRTGGAVLRVRLADLEAVLRAGPLQAGLVNVMTLLGRPVRDRAAEADALQRAVDEVTTRVLASRVGSDPWFAKWLEGLSDDGTVRRLIGEGCGDVLVLACSVFELLPTEATPLPVLAMRATGTTKGLDPGQLSTLVLRGLALRAGVPKPTRAAERRALWEAFGVVVDDLSSDVLVLNLPAVGRTRLDEWLRGAAADGIPMRLTLHQLTAYHLEARGSHVWVCENPAVMRAAAQRLGAACAPMVCSEGRPSTAFDMLIDALARHGCELAYHGDFDWPGLRIADAIRSRHGVAMWRMGAADYRDALATLDIADLPELGADMTSTPWDPDLAHAMAEVKRAVFEESVLETLLEDVAVTRAPRPSGRARTSVRELTTFSRCPHRAYLDRHGNPDHRVPTSAFLELLWEDSALLAETVLAGSDAARVEQDAPWELRRQRTLDLMHAGKLQIAGAVLDIGDLSGEVPLLKRLEQPSDLGTFSYIPAMFRRTAVDIESGSGERHALALCGFAELLDHVQRWKPPLGIVIGGEGDEREIDLEAFRPRYRELRRHMRRVLLEIESTRPGSKSECRLCRWRAHCHGELVAVDDLTLIPSIGEAERARIGKAGVTSREQLAGSTPDVLRTTGLGKRRAEGLIRAARVQRSGRLEVLGTWSRPAVDLEIAYDIEDDVFEPYVYLHGLLLRPRNAANNAQELDVPDFGTYEPVSARLPETEREVWSRFLERIARFSENGSYCVYVYGSHERTTLRHLGARYGGMEILEPFIARFVDVHDAIKNTVVLPTESTSLKAVARWIGFEWRDTDPGGAESLAWWAEYAHELVANAASRDRILTYNEDDLRATMVVVDWLAQLTNE